ncbi:MAG: flagellar biosynthetic protein FliO [Oscillospiraceae bacterium]|jgi:flagellar biosynthetic protein FliO|nr:flagellar biosynthetic protein FliO [Oscillospiraceae bacterium]
MDFWFWVQFVCSLAGVVGLIFLLYWLLKKVKTPTSGVPGGENKLRIISRAYVTRETSVAVVKAGERYFLVGVSPSGVQPVAELSADDFPPTPEPTTPTKSFAEILAENTRAVFGKKKSGE